MIKHPSFSAIIAVGVAIVANAALANGIIGMSAPALSHHSDHGAANVASQNLIVHDAWARATPPSMRNGAVYLTIVNRGRSRDRLLSASTGLASRTVLHRTKMDDEGVMRMRHVDGIDIPAGKSVRIAPGGYHVMLMGLHRPLVKGQSFPLTLRFERAGALQVTVNVVGIRDMHHGGDHGAYDGH